MTYTVDEIYLDFDSDSAWDAYEALRNIPGAFPRAVSRALNRTLEFMRTESVDQTKKRYFVKAGDVRKTITLKKSNSGNLFGAMVSRSPRRTLADYKITPRSPNLGKRKLMGAVKQEGGLKTLPQGTFLISTPNTGVLPFIRVRKGKWGIQKVMSPSIPQIVKNTETYWTVQRKAQNIFEKRLKHEVLSILGAFK